MGVRFRLSNRMFSRAILARRVIPTSRRTVWSDVLNSHGTNTWELAYWSKINKVFMPCLAAVSIVIGIKVRHEHHIDRDPWNSAPWMNVADMSQPFEGKKNWFYDKEVNFIPNKGFEDGNNDGVKNQCHGPEIAFGLL